MNINEQDFINHKISVNKIEPLEIYIDEMCASSNENKIPAKYFPKTFNVKQGKSYKRSVIKFCIPYSGDSQLLRFMPSSRLMWSMYVQIIGNNFCFEIIDFENNADEIKKEMDYNVDRLIEQHSNLISEVDEFNKSLDNKIRNIFKLRKEQILKNSNTLASLGVPIKKISTSKTFAIPDVNKKNRVIITKPEVKQTGYTPEPTLDDNVYQEILKMIHDVGKMIERLPNLYANKHEEQLRDHFLMMLEPNFEGSATGETFNNKGKTDILLRYEGSNIFIGECKFWGGKRSFLNTIDQLLGYLTWRDSKAAIIIFVPNKDFSSVITTVNQSIKEHPNFLRIVSERESTWLDSEIHLNNDRNRIVKIAIMLYHTPR